MVSAEGCQPNEIEVVLVLILLAGKFNVDTAAGAIVSIIMEYELPSPEWLPAASTARTYQ